MNKLYSDDIRVDPLYQDYYIFQTMDYFKVSQTVIDRTQEEFRKIQKDLKEQGKQLKLDEVTFEKELIKLALKREQLLKTSS